MDYAQELGDSHLISYILMRRSNITAEMGQPGHALGLANAALRNHVELPPRLRAVAFRQQATTYALLEDRESCAGAIDKAMTEAMANTSHEVEEELAGYCSPSYVEMEAASCWVQLGEPDTAIEVYETSLAKWPLNQQRDRGLCVARLSTAYALVGEMERACAFGSEALDIAHRTGSVRMMAELRRLSSRLGARKKTEIVSDLQHEIEQLVRKGTA